MLLGLASLPDRTHLLGVRVVLVARREHLGELVEDSQGVLPETAGGLDAEREDERVGLVATFEVRSFKFVKL